MEEPTASPLFPKDLATLVTLGPDQVRMLVREYGLGGDAGDEDGDDEGHVPAVRGAESAKKTAGQKQRPISAFTDMSDAGSWMNAGLGGSREDDINRFMRYIGVSNTLLISSSWKVQPSLDTRRCILGQPVFLVHMSRALSVLALC